MSDKRFIVITGGARSGKSSYAERLATTMSATLPVLFLATATAGDDEMRQRIIQHRQTRPAHWVTLEEPRDPAQALVRHPLWQDVPVILLDCITLLVSNLLTGGTEHHDMPDIFDEAALTQQVMNRITNLIEIYQAGTASMILVTNEVGLGLVPPYPLGRIYRDILGKVNMKLAANADEVYLLVAGIPLQMK